MKRKALIIAVAVVMCVTLVGLLVACGESDYEKIQKKGYFVCGITLYEPMNYYDSETEELVGFDTEFAEAVADYLGLEAKFQIIKWGSKYSELNSGAIDAIWNGFTANSKDEDGVLRSDKVKISNYYMNNTQCVVVRKIDLDKFTSIGSLNGKTASAESGSAGESFASSNGASVVGKTSQMDTFQELLSGAVDFVVIDRLMADKVVGHGDYATLAVADDIQIDEEKYAVGCRKGSDFAAKIDEAIKALVANGKLQKIAEKYNLSNALITNY